MAHRQILGILKRVLLISVVALEQKFRNSIPFFEGTTCICDHIDKNRCLRQWRHLQHAIIVQIWMIFPSKFDALIEFIEQREAIKKLQSNVFISILNIQRYYVRNMNFIEFCCMPMWRCVYCVYRTCNMLWWFSFSMAIKAGWQQMMIYSICLIFFCNINYYVKYTMHANIYKWYIFISICLFLFSAH